MIAEAFWIGSLLPVVKRGPVPINERVFSARGSDESAVLLLGDLRAIDIEAIDTDRPLGILALERTREPP